MKGYFLVFAMLLAFLALSSAASVSQESELPLSRVARDTCNPRECEQRCKRLGFPGGACINNMTKCDCDNF